MDTTTTLSTLEALARRAGDAILRIYDAAGANVEAAEISTKGDDSPLTAADLASHEVIAAGLSELTPDIPVLSEEARALPFAERKHWTRFWLVDPLDGTKEFIKRNGEFTVNIALVDAGTPTLGVVYAPVPDRMYAGIVGQGAWRQEGKAARQTIRAEGSGKETLAVVASRSHPSPSLASFLATLPGHALVNMGSSLKLCLVADGTADIYPRLGPTMEWDTGAAHAVVAAAGGQVVNRQGQALAYNKENLLNPHFLVLGERTLPWREAWAAADASQES